MHIGISEKIQRIDSSEIRKIFDLAGKLKNPRNLSIGQPDFPVPKLVKDSLIQAILDNKNSYTPTQGILPLREKLSQTWKKAGIDIKPENILVSAGVAGILYLLYETLFNPGDQIVILEPYFLIYESLSVYHGLHRHYLPEDFGEEEINALMAVPGFKPKAVIFSTPSNPTGYILKDEQIRQLGRLAEKYNAVLISDEIYNAFDYDKRYVPTASIVPERTITLGGFSKSHAMTGLRVGYMGVSESLSYLLQKVTALQQYSIVCSPAPCQWAAVTALENPVVEEVESLKKRRNRVIEVLKGKVKFPYPDGAFYVFPEVPMDSREFVKRAVEKELLVVPGYIFTKNQNTIRISYAQREDILEDGLQLFLEVVRSAG